MGYNSKSNQVSICSMFVSLLYFDPKVRMADKQINVLDYKTNLRNIGKQTKLATFFLKISFCFMMKKKKRNKKNDKVWKMNHCKETCKKLSSTASFFSSFCIGKTKSRIKVV